jgi:hypothetical protein
MSPLINQVRVDRYLTTLAVTYGPTGHIADRVLPTVNVADETGIYWVYDKTRFNLAYAKRAPRTIYKEIEWGATTDSYAAEEYGLEIKIDDRERSNSGLPADLDETGTEILTDVLLNNREQRVASLVMNAANFPAGHTVTLLGADQWTDPTSTPIDDIEQGRAQIRSVNGVLPNRGVMGYAVWSKLKRNQQILTELNGERPTLQNVAELFELEELIVGSVLYNTTTEGQTEVLGDRWGKDFLLYYQPPRPNLRVPGFGYQLVVQPLRVFRYREQRINCDVIRVTEIRAEKIVAITLGYLFKSVVP